jgi:hypothetical protein
VKEFGVPEGGNGTSRQPVCVNSFLNGFCQSYARRVEVMPVTATHQVCSSFLNDSRAALPLTRPR